MYYQVKNIDIDVTDYKTYFCFDKIDIEVSSQYIDTHNYYVVVRRLDDPQGWNDDIHVLVYYQDEEKSEVVFIGKSEESEKRIQVHVDFEIKPSEEIIQLSLSYKFKDVPHFNRISRQEFNERFHSDIVTLPHSLYAVGLNNNSVYLYNEKHQSFFMIEECVRHILKVALTFTSYDDFYFIISAYDGYMEGHYNHFRTVPRSVEENEYKERAVPQIENIREYPVFHKKKYIVAQANHKGMPYVLDVVDRHYFYHNLYNPFRSYHKGVPFHTKKNRIVFGGQDRGGKHNFTHRHDIDMNQREYFKSAAVPKENIDCEGWIDRSQMIYYKYILDIDGNSSTWDATAWKLNSGSVFLKTSSGWRQWFYDEFVPGVNYIEIKDDFSDLQEKFEWCENHQEECMKMIETNKKLFQKLYRYSNIMKYTVEMLDKIHDV